MPTTHKKVDVVTIGAGATASMLAAHLCEAGHSVVSLEQGAKRWAYPEFAHDHDSLRYSNRYGMMMDLADSTYTWRPGPRDPALPMRQYGSFNVGTGLGGSMVHWSGQLWRYLDTDFRYRSHHVERYGEDKLPPGSRVRDWGVAYADLEAYYTAFDRDIGSSGKAGNLRGRKIEGGNVFEEPRSEEYPNPELAPTAFGTMFAETTRTMGFHPFTQPSAILSRAFTDPRGRQRSGCLYCGFCTRFGCEVDAKSSPQTTHLPWALQTGNYEVRLGSKALRIETDRSGRATGVTYVDAHGGEHFQPAELVAVTAFTLETVRMLLLSKGAAHPRGVGNDGGLVGTNFTYQLFYEPAAGVWPDRKFQLYSGNTSTMQFIYDFYGDVFDHSDLDFVGGAGIYSEPGERSPLSSVGDFTTASGRGWGAEWKRELARDWDSWAGIRIQGESLPYDDQFLDLDPNYRDRWGSPLLRLTFDWHDNDRKLYRYLAKRCLEILKAMSPGRTAKFIPELPDFEIFNYKSSHPTGGAIMGPDAGASVTNTYGQVWDTPNVFVFGAALFPQNPGANPTGTVAAVTYRAAEAIRDRWFKDPEQILD